MALNPNERKSIIDFLTTNCECWKGNGDAEVLNRFSDEKLAVLKVAAEKEKQAIAVANAAVQGFSDGSSGYRLNPETGKWEKKVVNALATGDATTAPKVKKARPEGEGVDRPDLSAVAREGMVPGYEDEGMSQAAVTRENRKRMRGERTTMNNDQPTQQRPRTADEWLRIAPPEVQNQWRAAQEIEKREKVRIINDILANSNVSEQDRQAHHERLMRRSVEDLNNDLSMMHRTSTEEDRRPKPRQAGKMQTRNKATEDMLTLPTMNWQEIGGSKDAATQSSQAVAVNSDSEEYGNEPSEEEVMNQLPPSLRKRVAEANAVQAREKQRLIEEIVNSADLQDDEEQERRLMSRLQNKSLAELNDLTLITRKRGGNRPINYFGGSTTTPTSNRSNDPTEDVLPLPTMNWSKEA